MTAYRFRPRYRLLAFGAIALGVFLVGAALAVLDGEVQTLAAFGGALGAAMGVMYLRSPAWQLTVHVDDAALEVTGRRGTRFRLPWAEVKELVASPSTHSCFVDGGAVERSLLVPGDGAPAPYDIERRAELYAAIVAHVPAERVREVETLDRAT